MARSLSLACRRLQFNKLRFYLYDNTPVDFTGVNKRRNYGQIDPRTFDSLATSPTAKALKQLKLPLATRDSLHEKLRIMMAQKQHRLQSKKQRDNNKKIRESFAQRLYMYLHSPYPLHIICRIVVIVKNYLCFQNNYS